MNNEIILINGIPIEKVENWSITPLSWGDQLPNVTITVNTVEKSPKGYWKGWFPWQLSDGRKCPECGAKLEPGAGCHACWFCDDCGIGGCDNQY